MKTALHVAQSLFCPDPVFRKEMLAGSRHLGGYALRTVYLGILLVVVWFAWAPRRSGWMGYSEMAWVGRRIFEAFGWAQLILLSLFGIVIGADQISSEVRRGTLGLLLLTPLGPWRVVWGKWKSCMAVLALLVAAALPVFSVSVFMGAVDPATLGTATVLFLALASASVALGVMLSSFFRHPVAAIVIGVLVRGGTLLWPAVAVRFTDDWEVWAAISDPFYALVLGVLDVYSGIPEDAWVSATGLGLLASLVFLCVASLRAGSLARVEPGPPVWKRLGALGARLLERINPGGIRVFRSRHEVWKANPVLWKELRFRLSGRVRTFIWISVALLLLSALIVLASGESIVDEEFYAPAYSVSALILLLLAIGAGASSFAREEEDRRWEMLVATPIRGAQFVSGKLCAAGLSLVPLFAVSALFLVPVIVKELGEGRPEGMDLVMPVIAVGVFLGFVLTLGTYLSLRFMNTRRAFSWTFLAVAGILIGIPVMIAILEASYLGTRDGEALANLLIRPTNPVVYFEILVYRRADHWDRAKEQVPWLIGLVGLYGGVSMVIWLRMVTGFDRLARRNP